MPSDQELNKLSDEHKAMLAQKCVDLLMRGKGEEVGTSYSGCVEVFTNMLFSWNPPNLAASRVYSL